MLRLRRDFDDRADAVAATLVSKGRLSDRVLRCIVVAAAGDERKVLPLVELGTEDSRDVLVAGEYVGGRRVRDLRESFLIDSPEKFWAAEAAWLMARRGYRLIEVSGHSVAVGPANFMADLCEGSATFAGPKGQFTIQKTHGRWMMVDVSNTTSPEGLNVALSDERAFLDAVSGYLLTIV